MRAVWYNAPMAKGGVPDKIDMNAPDERARFLALLTEIERDVTDSKGLLTALRHHPKLDGTNAKSQVLAAYRVLTAAGDFEPSAKIERLLRGRPVRTISGVAPVAVLTEPYPCPGECLFCPSEKEAPKSYLDGEPGVLRAIQNHYDPYEQTHSRLTSLQAIGHPLDKIELLILGGTWSAYPEDYRSWFLKRCFDALNGVESPDLESALARNESSQHRNVGTGD